MKNRYILDQILTCNLTLIFAMYWKPQCWSKIQNLRNEKRGPSPLKSKIGIHYEMQNAGKFNVWQNNNQGFKMMYILSALFENFDIKKFLFSSIYEIAKLGSSLKYILTLSPSSACSWHCSLSIRIRSDFCNVECWSCCDQPDSKQPVNVLSRASAFSASVIGYNLKYFEKNG